jgi:hypothetical protein
MIFHPALHVSECQPTALGRRGARLCGDRVGGLEGAATRVRAVPHTVPDTMPRTVRGTVPRTVCDTGAASMGRESSSLRPFPPKWRLGAAGGGRPRLHEGIRP